MMDRNREHQPLRFHHGMSSNADAQAALQQDSAPAGPFLAPPAAAGNVYQAAAVCGVLLLAVGLVFGRAVWYEFIEMDDSLDVYENPHITGGLTAEDVRWALVNRHAGVWMPFNLDFPHARLPGLRSRAGRSSSHQRTVARRHSRPAIPRPPPNDPSFVAQRFRRGSVCAAPAAGRIGGLGHRAKGPSQRIVLHARTRGLRLVRASSFLPRLPRSVHGCDRLLCARSDGQADAGNAAICALIAGLLATRAMERPGNKVFRPRGDGD